MKFLGRFLRHILVWWVPGLLVLLAIAVGALAWLVAKPAGTRLLLAKVAEQLDARIDNVQGSLWHGLRVGQLELRLPGVEISAQDLAVTVTWPELWYHRVLVPELAASSLHVGLTTQPEDAKEGEEASGGMPALPVAIEVRRLAVGQFSLTRDGQSMLPVTLGNLAASLSVDGPGAQGAKLRLDSLRVGHEIAQLDVQGKASLSRLAAPWPMDVDLQVAATGQGANSPLCLKQLDALRPAAVGEGKGKGAKGAKGAKDAVSRAADAPLAGGAALVPAACVVNIDAHAAGDLDDLNVTVAGRGADTSVDLRAALSPLASFPARSVDLALTLPDRSGATLALKAQRSEDGAAQRLTGKLAADRLDVGRLVGGDLPQAVVTTHADVDVEVTDTYVLRHAVVDVDIADTSRWNRQALAGTARIDMTTGARVNAAADWPTAVAGIQIDRFDLDVRLGRNRVRTGGKIGPAGGAITLDAQAPELAAFWPDLPGGARAQGKLSGTPARHRLELQAGYTPARVRPGLLGQDKADASFVIEGGWGTPGSPPQADAPPNPLTGWRGSIVRLQASHAGFQVNIPQPVTVAYLPHAVAPAWQWQVGAANIGLGLPSGDRLTLAHGGSRGGAGRWETAGRMDNFVLTPKLVGSVIRATDASAQDQSSARSRQSAINASIPGGQRSITLDASWDLKFAGTLSGRARVARRDGDLRIPGDPPIPLGLQALLLEVNATAASATSSRLEATLNLATAKMGRVAGRGSAMLVTGKDGALGLATNQAMRVNLNADIADLAWLGLFTGDATELGGSLKADIDAQGTLGGNWRANGTISGQKLRVVRIDDGVRLLDGTLSARLNDDVLTLDSLRFPNTLRVVPKDSRTRDWVTRDPDAKNGYVEAKGSWNLSTSAGKVRVALHRYAAMQRTDRFAMVSGNIDIDAALPRLSITGDITADAGWASIELLNEVPSLDDDVRLYRVGDPTAAQAAASAPMALSMDLNVDMGHRFFLTGMGLDTGLRGSLRVRYIDGKVTGTGRLTTQGGRIDAYGQRLQLRRGNITFQGAIDNPLLDIEALRTGEQVEAGVRVSGTAQRPRIDLVSYPDVSDVDKLSWLILGRAADASGSDTALLLSVGTALLGGGEPFYKRFGLDDVGIRSGSLGSSGSLLPTSTVASKVNDPDSALATQFMVASKNLANGITLSVEQAMSGAGTVGRASYRLSRRWSVDVKGGTVNGLALIYRTIWGD